MYRIQNENFWGQKKIKKSVTLSEKSTFTLESYIAVFHLGVNCENSLQTGFLRYHDRIL